MTVDEAIADAKDVSLRDLPPDIVEIGAGRGSNFARYAPGSRITVYEPNRFMHDALATRAAEHDLDLTAHAADLRDASLPTGSVDSVVSTLTLCSVPERAELVAEIRRVLRPGGRFHFVEHVAEPADTSRRRYQRIVRRPWSAVFDRCDTCADTDHVIAAAGFSHVDATIGHLGPALDPTARTYWGVAIR